MKELIGLHHIALHTRNTDKSIDFYKAFGAEIVDQTVTYIANKPGHSWRLTLLKVSNFVLELKEPSAPDEMDLSDCGFFNHICLQVSDVKKAVTFLKSQGVNSFIEPETREHSIYSPAGIRNAFMRGPDGEQVELIEYKN